MCGLLVLLLTGSIKWNKMDLVVNDGVKMMGFIAFVMLVAAGYANVLRETHSVESLVMATTSVINTKFGGAFLMLAVGMLITMGIGTSFGTIPVVASIYIPMGLKLGFGIPAIILLIGVAAALGDAGSPASDSTLGPTSGLNADGQHNHIWDTCVPTFIFFDIPLLIGGLIGALILG
jgi:putative amino acid transporter